MKTFFGILLGLTAIASSAAYADDKVIIHCKDVTKIPASLSSLQINELTIAENDDGTYSYAASHHIQCSWDRCLPPTDDFDLTGALQYDSGIYRGDQVTFMQVCGGMQSFSDDKAGVKIHFFHDECTFSDDH